MDMGCMEAYLSTVNRMSIATANTYRLRLNALNDFVLKEYKQNMDSIVGKIKNHKIEPYMFLNKYVDYLKYYHSLSPKTLSQQVITAKNMLEWHDVDISPIKFKLKVKLPRVIKRNKEALSKDDIVNILNACSKIRLKTYVLLLAATGMRAVEALSVRLRDFDTKSRKILLMGESTKTRVERTVFLTEEVTKQIESWLQYKYRTRRVCHYDKTKQKTICEMRTPSKNDNDLIFAVHQTKPDPKIIYVHLLTDFDNTLDRIGMGVREEYVTNPKSIHRNMGRRRITLHSFRRFVKSTISDLGYSDFSEYFIGHSGSTYYTKTDKQIVDMFKKIESHMTFLDYPSLERKGADVEAKVENLEQENQRLRHSDQLKEDALATLSDQVMKLMVEVQELKQR